MSTTFCDIPESESEVFLIFVLAGINVFPVFLYKILSQAREIITLSSLMTSKSISRNLLFITTRVNCFTVKIQPRAIYKSVMPIFMFGGGYGAFAPAMLVCREFLLIFIYERNFLLRIGRFITETPIPVKKNLSRFWNRPFQSKF